MKDYFRRIDSMLESHQMPAEYQSTSSLVYCNDCETKSTTKFHFLYHKCQNCAGYNTKVLQTVDQSKGDAPVTVVSVAGETSQSTGVSVHDITVTQDPSEDSEMSDSHEMLSSSPENTSSATLNQVSGLPERLSFLGEPAPFETATDTSSGRRDYSNGASGPPHV